MTMAPGTDALLGLRVSSHTVPAGREMPIGTVTGVTPAGRLSPGETVTLEVRGTGPDGKQGLADKTPKGHKPPGHSKKDERKQGKP